ncbi:hypothetical protein DENSPDRAFT_50681 [Dentipellis sp. KUC8613]|nr:hypothetical protein DENSPDRAFT_50681 [Dentipellis sp. KUC8613]
MITQSALASRHSAGFIMSSSSTPILISASGGSSFLPSSYAYVPDTATWPQLPRCVVLSEPGQAHAHRHHLVRVYCALASFTAPWPISFKLWLDGTNHGGVRPLLCAWSSVLRDCWLPLWGKATAAKPILVSGDRPRKQGSHVCRAFCRNEVLSLRQNPPPHM